MRVDAEAMFHAAKDREKRHHPAILEKLRLEEEKLEAGFLRYVTMPQEQLKAVLQLAIAAIEGEKQAVESRST